MEKLEALRSKAAELGNHHMVAFMDVKGQREVVPLSDLAVLTLTLGGERDYGEPIGKRRSVVLSVLPGAVLGDRVHIGGDLRFWPKVDRGVIKCRFSTNPGGGLRPAGLMRGLFETNSKKFKNFAFRPGRTNFINNGTAVTDDLLIDLAFIMMRNGASSSLQDQVQVPRFFAVPQIDEEGCGDLRLRSGEALDQKLQRCLSKRRFAIPMAGIVSLGDCLATRRGDTVSIRMMDEDGKPCSEEDAEPIPSTWEIAKKVSALSEQVFGLPAMIEWEYVVGEGKEEKILTDHVLYRPALTVQDACELEGDELDKYRRIAVLTSANPYVGPPAVDLNLACGDGEPWVELDVLPPVQKVAWPKPPETPEPLTYKDEILEVELFDHALRRQLTSPKTASTKPARRRRSKVGKGERSGRVGSLGLKLIQALGGKFPPTGEQEEVGEPPKAEVEAPPVPVEEGVSP